MINARNLGLSAVFSLALSACGQSDTDSAATVGDSASLFLHVPSDTPYLAGNLEPLGNDVIDAYLMRAQPALDAVQQELSETLEDLDTEPLDEDEKVMAMAMRAVLSELDGNLNREGMERLGLDLSTQKVVYGMGLFPVIRVGLSDPETLRATILRVLDNAGIEANEQNLGGTSYWRVSETDSGNNPVGAYISILDDHLAISVFPITAEAELLPAFLGQTMPADSDAAERLAKLNARHGYQPFGSGIMELNRFLDELMSADSITARSLASAGNNDLTNLSAQCQSEIRSLVGNASRLTMGTTELSADAVAIQYRVEIEPTLAGELAALVSDIPLADPLSKKLMEFSFGIRVGAARDFLRNKMSAIVDNPYQCEHLEDLNTRASETFAQLNQPLPPLVNNFRGVRASLSELPLDGDIPSEVRGLAAVHVEQPQMFVGMAQMFLPDLAELSLQPGEPPVMIPQSLVSMPGLVAYAALSDNAIGLSMGEGEQNDLSAYLELDASDDGTFLSTNYDMAAYLSMGDELVDRMDAMQDQLDVEPSLQANENGAVRNIRDASQQAFMDAADRNQLTMKLTGEGFIVDTRLTFK